MPLCAVVQQVYVEPSGMLQIQVDVQTDRSLLRRLCCKVASDRYKHDLLAQRNMLGRINGSQKIQLGFWTSELGLRGRHASC